MVIQEIIRNPNFVEPTGLVLYRGRERGLVPIYEDDISHMVERISARAETQFTSHTLRRTYGRTLWKAGVPLETIKELMGHSSIETTIRYLGVRMDDMDDAMEKLASYQEALICPQTGHFER